MTDIYFKAKNKASIETLRGYVINVIEPVQGIAGYTDAEGNVVPAVGDPDYWYTCVRVPFDISAHDGLESCDTEEGFAVCGGFA